MGSPIIFGGNNISTELQNGLRFANGQLITHNGPTNLIAYAQAETGLTTGYSLGTATLTSNFPSGVPTFGSGASGNLSLSSTSTNPILGTYSIAYVSSAATTAGDFLATSQFSIPFEMQGKVLGFKVAYNAASGATNGNFSGTSSNSFGVAFWDATNSTWIQPAGVFNLVQNSGVGIATGTVQPPSTCLAGRFVIYNANASAGAITMTFDDFYLGLQTTSIGPAMSDWQAYTPTLTSSGGGAITLNATGKQDPTGWWRQNGGDIEIITNWRNGTGGAPSGAAGTVQLSVPSGITLDTSKRTAGTDLGYTVGTASGYKLSSGSGYDREPTVAYSSGNLVVYFPASAASLTVADLLASSSAQYHVKFPVTGWSSNTVQSADTDTRVVAARYTLSGTQSIPDNTETTVIWNSMTFDTHAGMNTSTGVYKVPVSGYYAVQASTGSSSSIAFVSGNRIQTILRINGSTEQGLAWLAYSGSVTESWQTTGADTRFYNAGDTIEIRAFQDTSGAQNINSANSYVTIARLSGPAVVQSSDTVACRYYASSTSVSGADATVVWTTKDYDLTNSMASGVFTVPVSGKYQIASQVQVTATYSLNQNSQLGIFKNGVQVTGGIVYAGGANTSLAPLVTDTISCVAGDLITIKVNSSGSSPSLAATNVRNYVSITRVGN